MIEENRLKAARALEEAWSLLSQGRRQPARDLAVQAAKLDPGAEGPWLVLAAVGTPEESIKYLQRVLEINPNNRRAIQGLAWARERVRSGYEKRSTGAAKAREATVAAPVPSFPIPRSENQGLKDADLFHDLEKDLHTIGPEQRLFEETHPVPLHAGENNQKTAEPPAVVKKEHTRPIPVNKPPRQTAAAAVSPAVPQKPPLSRGKIAAVVAGTMVLCLFLSAAVMIPFSNLFFPSLVSANSIPGAQNSDLEPTSSPMTFTGVPLTVEANDIPEETSTASQSTSLPTITYAPTFTPVATATPSPTALPEFTSTPPPTVIAIPVQQSEIQTANHEFTGRWIDVDLANQMVYAYEDDQMVREFVVSTGTAAHPTVTGQFHIYLKYRFDDMIGPGYYLRDVPYVMYFYKGYGLHGTFWHDNFGTPMSHGCVNMRTDEAAWLYDFAPMGTLVNVH